MFLFCYGRSGKKPSRCFPTVFEEAAHVIETFPTPFAHYRGRGNRQAVQLYWVDGVLIAFETSPVGWHPKSWRKHPRAKLLWWHVLFASLSMGIVEQSQRRLERHVAFADLRGWSQTIKQSARGQRVHRELRGLCWEHFEELVHDAMECELQLIAFAQAKYAS